MSKADKMFEEMGLSKIDETEELFDDWITYNTKAGYLGRYVRFDTSYKFVETNGTITKQLHLAMHDKMKELGWLDE